MLELLQDPNAWFAFLTLTVMEIVLGIDNIVFLSVIVSRLPEAQAARARALGLSLALIFRILMLVTLAWIIGLTEPVVHLFGKGFSWRDMILIAGGLFLLYKATSEVHAEFEYVTTLEQAREQAKLAFNAIIAQIVVIDLVFSVDSIVTAVGMADHVEVMIAAVIVAVAVMYLGAKPVSAFINRHPTTKMLALSFLLLIGASLVADGLGFHIPRGYIYFAMAFSGLVEMVNIALRTRHARKH